MGNTPRQLVPGMVLLMTALLLCGVARYPGGPGALLYSLAAALLIAAAAFLASTMIALRPHGESKRIDPKKRRPPRTRSRSSRRIQAVLARIPQLVSSAPLPTNSAAILTTIVVSAIGLFALVKGWQTPDPTPAAMLAPAAGVLVGLLFPLLVLERHLAGMASQNFPDGALLARLCRVPMLALLGLGVASFLRWLDFPGIATLMEHAVAVVIGLVGVELILRGLAAWYEPRAAGAPQRCPADSAIAGMLRWQQPDLAGLSAGVSRYFGIDLSRSWALGFLRRATLPFVLGLAACCWLLTGVSALGSSERAVYESFGSPAGVFQPGLHLHLPWPLGRLRPVEFGTVHELPVVFGTDEAGAVGTPTASVLVPATPIEGAPPASADRLWDASHPSEASYLIASRSNDQQNFEVINIDLRVLYRVGLSDAAAREITYNVAAPDMIIQAAAGRMLARYFSRYTLWDVLGQNREAFIQGFQQGLQARVTELSTGIEIMGIVVEAIHPPAATAGAYEGVQTAATRSVVQIAQAKAEAARTQNEAQSAASRQHNEALAAATELTDQAKTELALFAGDRRAFESGGPTFLLERRLQHFNKALAGVSFTVVDHRIDRADAPVLDLRPPSSGSPMSISPND